MAKRKNESQSSMVNNHWSPATCATDLSKLTSFVMASWCLKAVFIRAKATVLVLPVFGIDRVTTVWDSWCDDDSRPIDTSPADSKKSHVFARARDADQPGVDIVPALLFCLAYCGH